MGADSWGLVRSGFAMTHDPSKTGEFPVVTLDLDTSFEASPVTMKEAGASRPVPPSAEPHSDQVSSSTDPVRSTERSLPIVTEFVRDRATLTVLRGLHAGQVFAVEKASFILGRGPKSDLSADDPGVSRRHARIVELPNRGFALEDLGSTNGTFVSSRRVQRAVLVTGDRIQLGPNLLLRFSVVDDAEDELQRRLYESSTKDALTSVYNRKYLDERLVSELAHARRHNVPFSVLMFDLDGFKKINDDHGHLAGDVVLRGVAAEVARLIRVEDVLARYGGEEFLILARSTAHEQAVRLAERTRIGIAALEMTTGRATLRITASFGVASLSEIAESGGAIDLVALADARLYAAKAAGRNRVCSDDVPLR